MMRPQVVANPFPHIVLDDWADNAICRTAAQEWPGPDWPHWISYDTPDQRKQVCPDWKTAPAACARLLAQMLLAPVDDWFGGQAAVPDSLLWGGGLHSMGRNGVLSIHLDHSHHPLTGLERRYSAVLFLNEGWQPEWGGHLALWSDPRKSSHVRILPLMSRLVVFETGDEAYHSVLGPLNCPEGVQRKSLAVFFHAEPTGSPRRLRAEFFGASHMAQNRDDDDCIARKERIK